METYLLIACAAVLLISAFLGYRKGILGVVFGLVSWILVLGLMSFGTPAVENYLKTGAVYEKFYNPIFNHIKSKLVEKENEKETTTDIIELITAYDINDSESVGKLFDDMGILLPAIMRDNIVSDTKSEDELEEAEEIAENVEIPEGDTEEDVNARIEAVNTINENIADAIAEPIASMMVRGCSILLVVILVLLLTRIIGLIVNALNELPVVGGASRILGAAWGLCSGLLLIWLLMDVASCFAMTVRGQETIAAIQGNVFLNGLYEINPLSFLIR